MFPAAAAIVTCASAVVVMLCRHPLAITRRMRRRALRRAGFVRAAIPTSVGDQAVWQRGDGPLLVLLHGIGDDAGTWSQVAPALARRFRVWIPDLAGHGASQPAAGPLNLDLLLRALEDILNSVEFASQSLTLAGNSLGAWLSLLYAVKHPERVTRVILINGAPLKDLPPGITLTPQTREEARRGFDAVLDPSTRRPPRFVLDEFIRTSHNGPIARLMSAGQEDRDRHLLEREIPALAVPVDLVWGVSDRLVPIEHARDLQSRLPNARLTTIERCGHAPQIERPQALLEVLERIL